MTSMMSLHLLYRLLVSLQGRDNAYQQYCLLICPPPPFGLLTSTVNLQQHNVFCPPRPIENTVDNTLVSHNVSQASSDSRLETAEERVDSVIESVTSNKHLMNCLLMLQSNGSTTPSYPHLNYQYLILQLEPTMKLRTGMASYGIQ